MRRGPKILDKRFWDGVLGFFFEKGLTFVTSFVEPKFIRKTGLEFFIFNSLNYYLTNLLTTKLGGDIMGFNGN